jgi:hypothetical protein
VLAYVNGQKVVELAEEDVSETFAEVIETLGLTPLCIFLF